MKKASNKNAHIGLVNKSNISQTQFFILFCLCFFMPATVLLPRLMVEYAGNLAWVCPIVGSVLLVGMFFLYQLLFRAEGDGLSEKAVGILGKPLAIVLCIMIMLFCLFLASFYARHFAERVLMVYLTDTSTTTIILGLLIVVLIALSSGLLSFARLCEVMFYIFVVVFLLVTLASLLDGLQASNIVGFEPSDIGGILKGSLIMFLPFCIFICMSFFGERVNWRPHLLGQGIKSSAFLMICSTAVVLLCVGSLGVFGTKFLQMPYFALTRQIEYLGPMKNIGSIVFSMWILSDFAIVATLCYSAAGVGQSITHYRHRKTPIYVSVVIVFFVSIFAYRDMSTLNFIFDHIILPASIAVAIGVPILLLAVALIRGKVKLTNQDKKPQQQEIKNPQPISIATQTTTVE